MLDITSSLFDFSLYYCWSTFSE